MLGQFFEVDPGDILVTEGQAQDSLYVVLSGSLSVTTHAGHNEVELTPLTVGSCFGEMGLVDDGPASATIKARERTHLWGITRNQFDQFIDQNPQGATDVLWETAKVLAHRLREANHLIRRAASLPLVLARGNQAQPPKLKTDGKKSLTSLFSR
jgi:CRP-like cAMP-binding protein